MRKAKIMMQQEEEEKNMKQTKMNAHSRRLLEKRQQRAAEAGEDSKIVNGQVVRVSQIELGGSNDQASAPGRRTAKSVPTGTLNLGNTVKRSSEADA